MFAPSKLKKGKMSPKYSGVYIPFYTFDSETFSKYTAWRGDYYYNMRQAAQETQDRRTAPAAIHQDAQTRTRFRRGCAFLRR